MSEFFEDFVSLFFPRNCYGCHEALVRGEYLICTRCVHDLPRTDYHLHRRNALFERLNGRIALTQALAFLRFEKETAVQHLLHALKYGYHPEIGEMLGRVYGQELKRHCLSIDVVIPVPLHSARYRSRGYNQSASFAKGLSDALDCPCTEASLVRIRKTETQTRKSRLSRWLNVENAFEIADYEPIRGQKVLLVDDVITTGATIEACGRLLNTQCDSLSVACIAVA